MRVFPFIHSHDCVIYGILLHKKKQNRRQFLLTPLKGCLRRQRKSWYVFSFRVFRPGFSVALNNLITERMKKKIRKALATGKCSVVWPLIWNEIHFDAPDKTSFCERIVSLSFLQRRATLICATIHSSDDFATRSFEFSYHWFHKA